MESPQEIAPQRLLMRVPEVAERLGIGSKEIYEMIVTLELPTIHIGLAVRDSASALQEWVEEREHQGGLTA
jgi:excisionase family DNA binding protein